MTRKSDITNNQVADAYERLNLGDRDLDDLYAIRGTWVLNVSELEAVNEAIREAEEQS